MKRTSSKPYSSSSSSSRQEKSKNVLPNETLSKSKHKSLSSNSRIAKTSSDQSKNKPKNSQSDKKLQEKIKKQVEVDTKVIEEDENQYEDDFENYESDFEEEEQVAEDETQENEPNLEVELQEEINKSTKSPGKIIQSVLIVEPKAVIESNELVDKWIPSQKLLQPNQSISATQTAHFDFKSAKQQLAFRKVNSIIKKRWNYLKNVITLDSVSSIHFSQPPIPYEIFMNLYGMTHMTQSYVQSGDDDVNEECETEIIETSERWTQFPPHINCKEVLNSDENTFTPKVKDWLRLAAFIRASSKIIFEAMEESRKESLNEEIGSNAKNLVLHPPKFLRNSTIQQVAFAKHKPSLLLIAYNCPSSLEINRHFLLEWDTRWPTNPQRILSCFSLPNCCCFDANGKLAFAGMVDGSVSVWDLEEHDNTYNKISFEDEEVILKSSSYNTAEIMKTGGPNSSIKAIDCLEEESAIAQVVVLEESAVFHIWIVLTSGESESFDLGMAPLGRVRLVKTYTISLLDQLFSPNDFRVLDYVIHPQNSNTLLVTTDAGFLFSTSLILNKRQRIFKHALELAVEVVSLCFLQDGSMFLCGFGDLTVQMFSELKSKPVRVWHVDENIVNVCCSQSTIFVLGDQGEIVLWKHLDDEQKVTKRKSTKHKSMFMDLIGINKTQLVIGYEGGIAEINQLIKNI